MKTKNEIEFEITHYNELINDYKSMGVLYKKQVVKFQRKLNKVKKELANLDRKSVV